MSGFDDLKKGIRFAVQSVERKTGIYLGIPLEYGIEVKVVTRLGKIPVRGVKLTVGTESWGASDKDGCYKDGTAVRRKKTGDEKITIKAVYENTAQQLRKEQVTVSLSEVDPDAGAQKCAIKYEIPKVQDVMGTSDDIDFKTESDGTGKEGELEWVAEGDVKVLKVTLRLSTFSLAVPYASQRASDGTVQTIPGDGTGHDPEQEAHAVGPFSGDTLCYPTSVSMLVRYWGQEKTRDEVMQKNYAQWAEQNFAGRPDRVATRGDHAPTAADGTAGSNYWLDTSADDPGYALYRPSFETSWEDMTTTPTKVDYKQQNDPAALPGADLAAGAIWKDTSGGKTHYKKYVKRDFATWTKFTEEDWRVRVDGDKVWKWPVRAVKLMEAWKPDGATATREPARSEPFLPLTKVESDDFDLDSKGKRIDLPSDILAKYKDWLSQGWPFILATSATDGHMMTARGAVVNKAGEIEWLIVNDPYGSLAYRGTMTTPFKISGSVGLGATNDSKDVALIQAVLSYLEPEHYSGDADGICSGKDDDALVKAIKAYQGGKSPSGKVDPGGATLGKMQGALGTTDVVAKYQKVEKNTRGTGPEAEKGKHAYYRNKTMGLNGKLRIKGDTRGYPRIEKKLTPAELADKLTPGA